MRDDAVSDARAVTSGGERRLIRASAQNVIYSEAIFTALIQVRAGLEPEAMWAPINRGFATAGPRTRLALVVDAIRDNGRAEADARQLVA